MFQFPRFTLNKLCIHLKIRGVTHVSSLIRKSPDHRLFAPTRSLSQLITSFIASESQGIHRTLFVTFFLLINFPVTIQKFCIVTERIQCQSYRLTIVFSFNMSKNVEVYCWCCKRMIFHTHTHTHTHTLFVENKGVEPLTSCVQGRRSGQLS